MSSDDARQDSAHAGDRSVNTVLDDYPALAAAQFISGRPRWLDAVSRAVLLLSGGGLAYLATSISTIPSLAALLLWIVSGLAILVAVRPWSASIDYAGDAHGVYFPSRQSFGIVGRTKPPTWLFVPWSNVSNIGVQPLLDESGNAKGVTFCLRASDDERRVYFSGTAMLDLDERSPIGQRGSILVGYRSAFKSPYKIAATLRSLQRRQTDGIVTAGDVSLLTGH
jgi:hypothetical protein